MATHLHAGSSIPELNEFLKNLTPPGQIEAIPGWRIYPHVVQFNSDGHKSQFISREKAELERPGRNIPADYIAAQIAGLQAGKTAQQLKNFMVQSGTIALLSGPYDSTIGHAHAMNPNHEGALGQARGAGGAHGGANLAPYQHAVLVFYRQGKVSLLRTLPLP
jgi:hypothetical protein